MQVKNLSSKLAKYLTKHSLTNKFHKQLKLFIENPHHPSLNTEKLEPKDTSLYSFRINKKYRAIFHILLSGEVEIIDINGHYQ